MQLPSLLAFLAVAAAAQTTAPPAFEVASVRANPDYRQDDPRTWRPQITSNPTGVTARNVNLIMLVALAYDVQRPQVIAPAWVESRRYDVLAKTGAPAQDEEMHVMLQTLLEERFKLRLHRETREMEVLALILPKSGHKMKVSEVEGPVRNRVDPERGPIVEGATLEALIKELSRETSVPIIDLTGLKGRFDFTFNPQKHVEAMRAQWQAGMDRPTTEDEARLIMLRTIIENELGLKLERRKAPVEVTMIDAAEKTPVEN
jgi:uncharacterized protein (TIGR03435 family)